jgi:hypothetical protein
MRANVSEFRQIRIALFYFLMKNEGSVFPQRQDVIEHKHPAAAVT